MTGRSSLIFIPSISWRGNDVGNYSNTQKRSAIWQGLGPEAAHHVAIGAETLALRVQRQSENAMAICEFLHAHPKIKKLYYPGLT